MPLHAAQQGDQDDDLRIVVITVENPTDVPVHVAVLSVAEDRSRNLIWPVAGRRDNPPPRAVDVSWHAL